MDGSDSVDHVPPKGIFLKQFHSTLPQVPAHKKCNSDLSNEDTYLRDCLTLISYNSSTANEVLSTTVRRSFQRPQAKNYRDFFLSQESKILPPQEGMINFHIDANRTQEQMKRIARGLFYFIQKQPMSLNVNLIANMIEKNQYLDSLLSASKFQFADGDFKFIL